MAMPAIRVAIAKGKRESKLDESDDDVMPQDHYEDPLQFLRDMVNNKKLSMSMRSRAAEQLLPYTHARIGEKGKKEKRQDDAHGLAKGRLAPKDAPTRGVVLRAVK
jgi:phage terminase small subunit